MAGQFGKKPKEVHERNVDKFVNQTIEAGKLVTNDPGDQQAISQLKRAAKKKAKGLAKNEKCKTYLLENNFDGLSALNNAVKRGYFYLAELLMQEFMIHPNTRQPATGKSALHYAAECQIDNQDFFENLVTRYGADVNAVDVYSVSVLHLSVYHDKLAQVNFLLENEATAGEGTHFGCPVQIAAFYGRSAIVNSIIQTFPSEANRVYQSCSPIECSAYAESLDCLLELSANCSLDKSILYKVISSRRTDEEALPVVEHLLTRHVDANIYDVALHETLPILEAARKGWVLTVGVLLEYTTRIPSVTDWTATGLIGYTRTEEQKIIAAERLANVKRLIIHEFKNRQVLLGCCLLKSVQYSIEPLELDRYDSFRTIMVHMGMYLSTFWDTDPQSLLNFGFLYMHASQFEKARDVANVCLLQEPDNEVYRQFERKLEKQSSGPSSSNSSRG